MSLHNIASKILISSMTTMGLVGGLKGKELANKICFIKKNTTKTEYIGECICYTTLVTGNVLLYSLITPTLLCSMPLLLPYKFYISEIDKKKQLSSSPKYGSKNIKTQEIHSHMYDSHMYDPNNKKQNTSNNWKDEWRIYFPE